MSDCDFARRELHKRGWTDGSGLGRKEDGITDAIKVKIKKNLHGVGHNAGKEFTYHWWDHAFNKAAESIHVEPTEDGVTVTKSQEEKKTSKNVLYGNFVKGGTLLHEKEETLPTHDDSEIDSEEEWDRNKPSEEHVFQMCGGRTAHKAARFGHKLNGKLKRIEEHEQVLLQKANLCLSTKSTENEKTEAKEMDPDCSYSVKKKKKKKKKEKSRAKRNEENVNRVDAESVDISREMDCNGISQSVAIQTEIISKKKKEKHKKKRRKENQKDLDDDDVDISEQNDRRTKKSVTGEIVMLSEKEESTECDKCERSNQLIGSSTNKSVTLLNGDKTTDYYCVSDESEERLNDTHSKLTKRKKDKRKKDERSLFKTEGNINGSEVNHCEAKPNDKDSTGVNEKLKKNKKHKKHKCESSVPELNGSDKNVGKLKKHKRRPGAEEDATTQNASEIKKKKKKEKETELQESEEEIPKTVKRDQLQDTTDLYHQHVKKFISRLQKKGQLSDLLSEAVDDKDSGFPSVKNLDSVTNLNLRAARLLDIYDGDCFLSSCLLERLKSSGMSCPADVFVKLLEIFVVQFQKYMNKVHT